MLAQLPPSYRTCEAIHEQRDRDETSLGTDVRDIADPDLILSRDLKGLQSIDPRV